MSDYTYADQLVLIKRIRVADGQTHRGNCPFCNGRNTFTLTRHGDELVWNCYRASCGITGSHGHGDSLAGIKNKLSGIDTAKELPAIPLLVPIEGKDFVFAYLDKVHSAEAYKQNLIDIRYAPAEDRICFAVAQGVGWVGRARQGVSPRWRKYGDCSKALKVGTGPTAVVVEDSASACAVGCLPEYTGVALLSTNLTDVHITQLLHFSNTIVALDKDATSKAVDLSCRLNAYVPTSVRMLERDLKWCNKNEIYGVLNANGNS